MFLKNSLFLIFFIFACGIAQDKSAYSSSGDSDKKGGLDVSRLTVNHSISFGMASTFSSSLQSQSMYSTLLTYQFALPVTVNLNFGFPIYSTFSSAQNFSSQNISSAQYFKSIPIDFCLAWKPSQNLFFQLGVMRNSSDDYFSGINSPFFYQPFPTRMVQSIETAK